MQNENTVFQPPRCGTAPDLSQRGGRTGREVTLHGHKRVTDARLVMFGQPARRFLIQSCIKVTSLNRHLSKVLAFSLHPGVLIQGPRTRVKVKD